MCETRAEGTSPICIMAALEGAPTSRIELLRRASNLCMTSTAGTALSRETYLSAVTQLFEGKRLPESHIEALLTVRDHLTTLLTRAAGDELEKWIEDEGVRRKLESLDKVSDMKDEEHEIEEFNVLVARKVAKQEMQKMRTELQNAESRLIMKNAELKDAVAELEKKYKQKK